MHQRQLGQNLLGLATQGSCARNGGSAYSDVELVAFLRTVSKVTNWEGPFPISQTTNRVSPVQIFEGLLIDLIWTTKEDYIDQVKEVTPDWYLAGSDYLRAEINPPLIDEINGYRPPDLHSKCRSEALRHWPVTQEATGKVLNAIQRALDARRRGDVADVANVGRLLFAMLDDVLIELAFLNERPYKSASTMLTEAEEELPKRPSGFADLASIAKDGGYTDLRRTKEAAETVFDGLEELFREEGIALYRSELLLPTLSQ